MVVYKHSWVDNNKFMEIKKKQQDQLMKHAVHHSPKHMALMRKVMKKGKTFGQAHKLAMKEVGK